MNPSNIRVRLKSTKQIVEVDARAINKNGELYLPVKRIINGEEYIDTERLYRDAYEIIPEQDFYDFRNNTAKDILLNLMNSSATPREEDEDNLISKAIRMTDKLIAKL